MNRNYCIYHLHSDLSNAVTNIDSVTPFQEYVNRAKECGMKAMAFSEHGSVMEWYHKKCAIEAAGQIREMTARWQEAVLQPVPVEERERFLWYLGETARRAAALCGGRQGKETDE